MMMKLIPYLSAALILLIGQTGVSGQAKAACLSPAESRQVIKSGGAMPFSVALRRAGIEGKVVRVALCMPGPVYQVSVLGRDGNLRSVTIPAK